MMRRKKQILEFLHSNHIMINSLMCKEERRVFNGDVVEIIEKEVEMQIAKEENK